MQPKIRSGYYKHLQIESGWRLDTRVLNVTLADCSDPAVFIAFDIGSRKVICSSPHKDGLSGLIDVLNRAIRKHGAPSQVICELLLNSIHRALRSGLYSEIFACTSYHPAPRSV